ncbi:hypothetical protein EON77_06740 [bacterium]|nr:MAG: hypothetical protein EON77_06740 [bacterium]
MTDQSGGPARPSRRAVAVIGIGCWFPGSPNPRMYWENILGMRRQFRPLPKERTPLTEYWSPDPQTPDTFYQAHAAVIDGFAFDWSAHRIPQSTFLATDVAQWLALEVAERALLDAGYARKDVPKFTGAFVGNTDTGEQMRATSMRLRWPFVAKALRAAAADRGMPPEEAQQLGALMEGYFKSVFPTVSEDYGAGNISATIAGRICNYFDMRGGGYVVDGACASSLVSI